jgi:hypothetical protein
MFSATTEKKTPTGRKPWLRMKDCEVVSDLEMCGDCESSVVNVTTRITTPASFSRSSCSDLR